MIDNKKKYSKLAMSPAVGKEMQTIEEGSNLHPISSVADNKGVILNNISHHPFAYLQMAIDVSVQCSILQLPPLVVSFLD